ncbi:hypothetical protein GWI33_021461 [Rhynchophorus ferrugineus]|uniref:Uncharacterized protein n=1 Tax=Rhynchophorus ferrugineus TaxID=354439 RepID=A0A834ITQ6_RHYFE|nr:hypothetical protein GWI33_021461 [Rhynchophorus ferrugineus]
MNNQATTLKCVYQGNRVPYPSTNREPTAVAATVELPLGESGGTTDPVPHLKFRRCGSDLDTQTPAPHLSRPIRLLSQSFVVPLRIATKSVSRVGTRRRSQLG